MHREKLIVALVEQGLTVFSVADARAVAEDAGVPEERLSGVLLRMVESGWLSRLRRGLYAVSGPFAGGAPAHPFSIAVRLVTPSAISHWSALHQHGLTEQVPRIVTAFTPRKVITPGMRTRGEVEPKRKHAWVVEGVRYEYTTVTPEHYFGIEQVWLNERERVPIMDRERTVLEMFSAPRTFGGIGEGIGVLGEHLVQLSIEKLVRYALHYGAVSAAKRLGWALEHEGAPQSALTPLRELPSTGYHLLEPSGPRGGLRERRWMLRLNLPGAVTE